jgi:osmotically-inducible protein OsmY
MAIADAIRQMFDTDPSLAGRATNVKTTVQDGRVTLEGIVPTRADKRELERRIATIANVIEINDKLDVGVPGR